MDLEQVSGHLKDVLRVADAHADAGTARKLGEPRELLRANHFIRNQHIADTALDHRLGLRHLLAADADRAGGKPAFRDLRPLVGLRAGTGAEVTALRPFAK